MPVVNYYVVTQEREVKVSATDVLSAAQTADKVLNDVDPLEIPVNIIKPVRVTAIHVREDF